MKSTKEFVSIPSLNSFVSFLYFLFVMFLVIPCTQTFGQESDGKIFIVATGGSDNNPGTADKPFATLAAAVSKARTAGPGNHMIVIRPGEYFVDTPVELDGRDNGLSIIADTSGKVTIYGGKLVTGWRRDGDKFWCADLPGIKEGSWDFRALVVNGRMPERARMPESGTLKHLSVFDVPQIQRIGWARRPTTEELTTMIYDPKDIPASFDIRNAEVRVYHMWDESLVGIAANDTLKHQFTFSSQTINPPGSFDKKDYIILNTREGMTKPGQWYLDRTAGKVVYWPLEGEDMAKAKVIAPSLDRILRITGEAEKKAENVTIRGFSLQATTVPLRKGEMRSIPFEAALGITYSKNCVIDGIEISNAGGVGMSANQLTDCRIVDCHIHNTGSGGARVGGTGIFFARNHIHDVGLYYPSATGLDVSGSQNHIYRNEIHDVPYCGMRIGRSEILVEENFIYRVMRELQDGAAIYGGFDNSVLRGNVVRDVVSTGSGYGVSSYYMDEGAHDNIVEKNVSINVPRPVHNHIARNSVIKDNLFITEGDMILSFQSSAKFALEGNTLITPGKVRMVSPNGVISWKNNKIFSGGGDGNKTNQYYTIDSAMPFTSVPSHKTAPVNAVHISKAPVINGELSTDEWPGEFIRLDRELTRLPYSGAPVVVKYTWDNKNLYVAAMITMFDTANISRGETWGKDDGIEISIKGSDKAKPSVFIIRSYVNGTVQSITDAGAGNLAATSLGKNIRYVSKVMTRPTRGWIGEWIIPFYALGIKPKMNMNIPFNMCAFVNEYDKWHCWEGTLGETWQVDKAGTLELK